jgi:tetratricopeptide (TPR) repeat protein/transcriptional regulator with XRE-family HTH domain
MAEPTATFAVLLRTLRTDAGLTQEELAEASGLSSRAVSDLERGINRTARKDTARLLADALKLAGSARQEFEATARGRPAVAEPSMPGVAAATRALPRDVSSFTGRESELRELVITAAGGAVVGIHAIGGMAGVGKTAFAIHAAHRLAPHFPDGQIFLPLHGHTPGQRPADPLDALASLLLTSGVGAAQIPPSLEARMALWRDRQAGKQLLLILDDAVGSEQVQPLLPGSAGSLVLITSRRHLTALEDAQAISLDTLPSDEAAGLLVRLAARPGLAPDDASVAEIARLCGYLPLAIGMLARQLHHHPAWTAADLAADLTAARDRLELMAAENLSVAAALDLSYQELTPDQQRFFRLVGLFPGTEIDRYAAAALSGTGLAAAGRLLTALYDQYLLTEPARGRYLPHDLVREHARALAAADPAAEREAAVTRLLDYYLHTTRLASRQLARRPDHHGPDLAITPPADAPGLPTGADAVTWMSAERLNLHAVANYAAREDRPGYVVGIAAAMHDFLRLHGHYGQALALDQAAVLSAARAGDRLGEAWSLSNLGVIQRLTGDYPAATASLARALLLFRELNDRRGEATALSDSGTVQYMTGEYAAAVASLEEALELSLSIGDTFGQSAALNHLGIVHYITADYPAATASFEQAIALSRELGDGRGQANALNNLGILQQATGNNSAAITSSQQALQLAGSTGDRYMQSAALNNMGNAQHSMGNYRVAAETFRQVHRDCIERGDLYGQAAALTNLGDAQQADGDYRAAIVSLEQALELYRGIGDRRGQGQALNALGMARRGAGDPAAVTSLEQALELYRDLGDRRGQAEALNNLAVTLLGPSTADQGRAYGEQALAIAREITVPAEEARALETIGKYQLQAGQPNQAAASLRQAQEIYQRIGSPAADRISKTLPNQPP